MAYTQETLHVAPGQGEKINSMTVKVRAAQLGGDFSVMEATVESRQLLVPHVHQHEDQAVYIISGRLEFEVGGEHGEHFSAEAGSYVLKPRRISHGFWNPHDEPCRYIELSGRSGFEQFVDTTRDGALMAAMNAKRDFDVEFLYGHIPRLMTAHRLTSIAGVEGFKLPELPELRDLPQLRRYFS